MEKHLGYKITIEDSNGASAHFFSNGIDDILAGEYFNRPIKEVRSGEEFTIKNSLLNQLEQKRHTN